MAPKNGRRWGVSDAVEVILTVIVLAIFWLGPSVILGSLVSLPVTKGSREK